MVFRWFVSLSLTVGTMLHCMMAVTAIVILRFGKRNDVRRCHAYAPQANYKRTLSS